MQITNPATGAPVAEIAEATPADVERAYEIARANQHSWAALHVEDRVTIIERFAASVAERVDELAAILTAETGKPISQARGEIAATLDRIAFFCDHVERAIADEEVTPHGESDTREVIVHEPLGVIANISAWNYPWFVGTNVFVPALLTGNAVLYKPSEYATCTGMAIGDLLHEAGVPPEVFAVLPGAGDVGRALLDAPVDGVFFTGSYATGRAIAAGVADRLVRVQLELGGKDPVYVTDDVDVAAAAAALADGAFYNTGQSCCSVERIYVHDDVHDRFVDELVSVVEGFVVGDPTDDATYIGPLTRPQQADVLAAQVADALDAGATLRTGGHPLDGRPGPVGAWWAPTVLSDATNTMAVMREESFGPIIGVARVLGDEEAVEAMNDTDYGLTAGVFCRDEARARFLLARVDAGSAYWNCCDRVSPRLPWTGRHHSGIGSTLSTHGIRAFTQFKGYHLRRG